MRHFAKIFALLALLTLFSACEAAPLSATDEPSATPSPSESAEPTASIPAQTASPSPTASSTPEASPAPSAVTEDWEGEFRDFIEEKYDKILETFLSGVAGIGFADLDLDGSPELLMFDFGASAAMGVQIFDIVSGEVECVSANVAPVGEAFGGKHLSGVCVTANELTSFRLLLDKATGERLFVAHSGNGALDFLYSAIIKFARGQDGEVTVSKYLYRYEEYDPDADERTVISKKFEYLGQSVDEAGYTAKLEEFNTAHEDEGYELQGVFIWENAAYEKEYEGLFAMFDGAVKVYVPAAGTN